MDRIGPTGMGMWAACGLVALLSGCQPPPPPPAPVLPPPPVTMAPNDYSQMKAQYLRANPDARVGRVIEVRPGDNLLAVGDIPTKDFAKGDILSIVNINLQPIADGTVIDAQPDLLFVQYGPPMSGNYRVPMKGDVAIRATTPDRSKYK